MTENEMVGWHHQLDGHEFEKAPGVGDGQGSLECYSPWGCKVLDMTEQLNCTYLVAQLWPSLCDPMDYSLLGPLSTGIFQARILESVAMPSSRGSSQPRD